MTVVTRCQILRLKCTKSISAGRAYSAPSDLLAGFKGSTSKGDSGGMGEGREMRGKGHLLQGLRGIDAPVYYGAQP